MVERTTYNLDLPRLDQLISIGPKESASLAPHTSPKRERKDRKRMNHQICLPHKDAVPEGNTGGGESKKVGTAKRTAEEVAPLLKMSSQATEANGDTKEELTQRSEGVLGINTVDTGTINTISTPSAFELQAQAQGTAAEEVAVLDYHQQRDGIKIPAVAHHDIFISQPQQQQQQKPEKLSQQLQKHYQTQIETQAVTAMAMTMPNHLLNYEKQQQQIQKQKEKEKAQYAGEDGGSNKNKRKERLEQNRISARESRKRKKSMIEELQRTVMGLTSENMELNGRNQSLRLKLAEIGQKYPQVISIQSIMNSVPTPTTTTTTNNNILSSYQHQQQQQQQQQLMDMTIAATQQTQILGGYQSPALMAQNLFLLSKLQQQQQQQFLPTITVAAAPIPASSAAAEQVDGTTVPTTAASMTAAQIPTSNNTPICLLGVVEAQALTNPSLSTTVVPPQQQSVLVSSLSQAACHQAAATMAVQPKPTGTETDAAVAIQLPPSIQDPSSKVSTIMNKTTMTETETAGGQHQISQDVTDECENN